MKVVDSPTSKSLDDDFEALKRLLAQAGAPELFYAGILKHVQGIVERAGNLRPEGYPSERNKYTINHPL